jgi:digeranylgeranylglycerophospholipid reductase
MKYDAIVVGAGPAGSVTARFAASKGVRTLIIDKKRKVGEPVQCGEFMLSKNEIRNILPSVPNLDELFDFDSELISKKIHEIQIVSPKKRTYHVSFEGFSINRNGFDRYLVEKAQSAGAELKLRTVVTGANRNKVITNKGEFSADVIVGADGPRSRIAKWVGLDKPKRLSPCIFCRSKGNYGSSFKMLYGSVAPGGYAWIIPKEGGANIGLGIQSNLTKRSPKELFLTFLKKIDKKPIKISSGFVPISGPIPNTVKGNVIIVGDAAGHVMATNGGGIPTAMICGRIAGNVIGDHFNNGTSLNSYESKWRGIIGKELKTALKTKKLADKFLRWDPLLEMAMGFIGTKRINRAIKCKPIFRSSKIDN